MAKLLSADPDADTAEVTSPSGHSASWASVCLNCAAPLKGPFCGQCGQRALPPHPTLRALAGDAFEELSGWDGKVAETLRTLFRSPGELTRVLLEGRRVHYISPVRLYLLCSLVYFLVAAIVPTPADLPFETTVGFGSDAGETTPGDAAVAKAMSGGLPSLTDTERAALESRIAETPALFRPLLRALVEDARGLSSRAMEILPRALFVLIPALALILGIFYRGRPYPDHLYFAIHFQAFVFVMLTASGLAMFSRSLPVLIVVQTAVTAWIVVYAVIAQRRVYGGSWLATGLKAVGIAALYGALWSATTLAVTLWVSRLTSAS